MLLANDKFLQIYTEYQETYYAHTQYKNEGFLRILIILQMAFCIYSVCLRRFSGYTQCEIGDFLGILST
jgi:hypothetical protein